MIDRAQQIPSQSRRHGFTLVEMLVVIAIIVLAMTLAIPALRSLTGSRSIDAAENKVTSYIAMTRSEAIGLQRVEGVLFFLDTTTDHVNCVAVTETPSQVSDIPGVTYLDVVPDRDPISLPSGTRLWTIKDSIPTSMNPAFVEPLPNSRFLGFNWYGSPIDDPATLGTLSAIPGGVILFDGHSGQLTSRLYGFRFALNASNTKPPSGLGRLCFANSPTLDTMAIPNWPPPPPNSGSKPALLSQVGLVLFDRDTFANQPFIISGSVDQNDVTGGPTEMATDAWLDANATPVFVNRYDGTLMRAE